MKSELKKELVIFLEQILDDKDHLQIGYRYAAKKLLEKCKSDKSLDCDGAIELIQYFVDRVDKGEIRSKTTYAKYKDFLQKVNPPSLSMNDTIYKIFGDKRVKYFLSSDAHQGLAGIDTFIRYEIKGNKVILWMGGNNIDECPIKVCSTAEDLKRTIEAVIS